jgi:hypothetical protein
MDHSQRYAFEHGPLSFWRWNVQMVLPTMLVTWDGIWLPQQWHKPKNIFWRRYQSNGVVRCNHLAQLEQADEKARANWPKDADSAFQ